MNKAKILISAVIVLAITFVGLRFLEFDYYADLVRTSVLPLVLLYFIFSCKKRSAFFYFLLFYAIGDICGLGYYLLEMSAELDTLLYFTANILYITSYIFLIAYILKFLKIRSLYNKLSFYIFILLALDIYCIVIVTNIAFESENLISIYDYILEFSYNAVIMLLLTVALLNYIGKDSKKALLLFVGSVFIVLSEITQVAYFYVSELYLLNITYSLFLVLAFVVFILQYKLDHENSRIFHSIETENVPG